MSSSSGAQIQAYNHRNKSVQGNMSLGGQTTASDYLKEMEMDKVPDKESKIRELQGNAETPLFCA